MNKTMLYIGFLIAQALLAYFILEDLTWGAITSLYIMIMLLFIIVK